MYRSLYFKIILILIVFITTVMVVVGTKSEYFNAVWVKNEWSRFLAMMRKDRSKLLLPCYRDMDPYDLPEQLSVLQSYDMAKIGFMQDLIRGIKKIVTAGTPKVTATETIDLLNGTKLTARDVTLAYSGNNAHANITTRLTVADGSVDYAYEPPGLMVIVR